MHVLITGAAGYIGSDLTYQLLERGCNVTGIDSLSFGGESLLAALGHDRFRFVSGDIRNPDDVRQALEGCDSVVHLAAIVGDPACAAQPELTREVNLEASKSLLDICHESPSVGRFVFASTCSNYGRMSDAQMVDESSPLNPLSLYSETKVAFEKHVLGGTYRSTFVPTILRFATVYGVSPRVRFDLTVNDFVRESILERKLLIYGEQFWRPYCHVRDLARGCIAVLDADDSLVRGEVFGVGCTSENYQKKMIVDEIRKVIPDVSVETVEQADDPRDYRVNFSKIYDRLGFKVSRSVPDGIMEIKQLLDDGFLPEPRSVKYANI